MVPFGRRVGDSDRALLGHAPFERSFLRDKFSALSAYLFLLTVMSPIGLNSPEPLDKTVFRGLLIQWWNHFAGAGQRALKLEI